MASQLPPGFVLDSPQAGLPPGFVLDQTPEPPNVPGGLDEPTLSQAPDPNVTNNPFAFNSRNPSPGGGKHFEFTPEDVRGVGNQSAATMQGIGAGLAETVGLVPDLLAAPYNALSYLANKADINTPYIGNASSAIKDASASLAQMLGFEARDPESMPFNERVSYETARFAAPGGIFGKVLSGASKARTAAYGPRIARSPMIGDNVLAPYETAPAAAIAQDIAASAGSGTAVAAVNQVTDNPLAEFAAALVGGPAGITAERMVTSPAAIPRAMRDARIAEGLPYLDANGTPFAVRNKTADRAAAWFQSQLQNPRQYAEDLTTGVSDLEAAGLPLPTPAGIGNDLGAIFLENAARTRNPLPYAMVDDTLRQEAERSVSGIRPNVPEDAARLPQQTARDLNLAEIATAEQAAARAREQVDATRRLQEETQAAAGEIVGPYRSTDASADAADASRRLDRQVNEGALRPRTAEKNAAFEAADPDGTNMRDASPLIEAARAVRESANQLSARGVALPESFIQRLEAIEGRQVEVPGEPQTFRVDQAGVSERVAGAPAQTATEGGQVSVRDLNTTRRDVAVLEEKAVKAGDYNTAERLRALKNNIDNEFDRMIAEGAPGGAEIQEARDFYREQYAPFFGRGAGRQYRDDVQRDPSRTAAPPEATAQRFLGVSADHAAASQDLARINAIAESPQEAARATRDYIVASLAKTLGVSGQPSLRAVQAWRSNWSATLEAHPAVRQEVDDLVRDLTNNRNRQTQLRTDLDNYSTALRSAEADVAATRQRVGESTLSVLVNNSPRKAAAKILDGADPEVALREVQQRLRGHPEALEAWKANIIDEMTWRVTNTHKATPGGQDAVGYAAVSKFIESTLPALVKSGTFTPEDANAIRRAQKILEPLTKQYFRGTVGSPTAERNEQAWRTLEAGLKSYFGVLKGGGILRTAKVWADLLPDDTDAVQLLIAKATLDPRVAKHLATREINKVGTPAWNKQLTLLLSSGEGARGYNERMSSPETETESRK